MLVVANLFSIQLISLPRIFPSFTHNIQEIPLNREVNLLIRILAPFSGVTRVIGQPGQLTNKQLSRRSADRSWVGAAHRNPPFHFLIFIFEFVHFEAYDFRNTVITLYSAVCT